MTGRFTFGTKHRLRRGADYDRVFARRLSAGDKRLVVYVDCNDTNATRLGLAVGRRVGNAVHRHRIKRLIREAFRLSRDELPPGIDIVCVARPVDLKAVHCHDYEESLARLVLKAFQKL